MVFLNGVKYACERCIRGHRVSSCTHTEKPLTMIKPKGRPASQCPHCRELRKLKNTHTSCSCGKKGKPPGTHLASCLCHKNSHCTCPVKEKKTPTKKRTENSPRTETSSAPELFLQPPSAVSASEYLYDDVNTQFDSTQGFIDYLIGLNVAKSLCAPIIPEFADESRPNLSLDSITLEPQVMTPFLSLNQMANNSSDAELDAMESIFPLLPLVGSASFDDDKSLPLLPLPDRTTDKHLFKENSRNLAIGQNYGKGQNQNKGRNHKQNRGQKYEGSHNNQDRELEYHSQEEHLDHSNNSHESVLSQISVHTNQHRPQNQTPVQGQSEMQVLNVHTNQGVGLGLTQLTASSLTSTSRVNLQLHITSSPSVNGIHSVNPQQPHPIKPSTSFTIGHNNSKLRRPESVLSLASTLSNTSKQNLFETPQMNHHAFLKTPSSAAFPPFSLSGNNSTDDFTFPSYNLLSMLNDLQSMMFLSDEEYGHSRLNGVNGSVGSGTIGLGTGLGTGSAVGASVSMSESVILRQALQLRRTSSLSRSYSLLPHHINALKDHCNPPPKSAPVDGSPRLASTRVPTAERFYKPPSMAPFVPEEEEYTGMMTEPICGVEISNRVIATNIDLDQDSIPLEFQDFKSFPMYQDNFDGIEKHI